MRKFRLNLKTYNFGYSMYLTMANGLYEFRLMGTSGNENNESTVLFIASLLI